MKEITFKLFGEERTLTADDSTLNFIAMAMFRNVNKDDLFYDEDFRRVGRAIYDKLKEDGLYDA